MNEENYGAAISIRRQLITRLDGVNIKQVLWEQIQWITGRGDKPDDNVEWTMTCIREVDELIELIEAER